ncbi:MAG: hypothetical protein Q4A18_07305, partial [Rikenellaceae bacterium]|nr:hypothetical protein [Rikenellaceae bacterium]
FSEPCFRFEAKADAKVRQEFLFSKSFCKNFQKFFRTLSPTSFGEESGCKGKSKKRICKGFFNFFQEFFRTLL